MNNFDMNSKGINIIANIFYDECLSQDNFDRNCKLIDKNKDFFIYTDYGNLSSDFYISLKEESRTDLEDVIEQEQIYCGCSIDELDIQELQALIENELSYIDLFFICKKYHLEIEQNYELLTIRGFSQGDILKIFVNIEEFEKVTGAVFNDIKESLKEDLINYCYKTPLTARITINDQEIYLDGIDGNYIYYDADTKKQIIEICLKSVSDIDQDLLKEELEELLPEEIN